MLDIPDKSYFKIGEVSKIVGVEPYNIRYWESQFRVIRPSKTKSRQRFYKRKDIEILLRIKKLLYEDGFTIAGAKKRLNAPDTGDEDTARESGEEQGMAVEERQAYADLLAKSRGDVEELGAQVERLTRDLQLMRRECAEKLEVVEAERRELVTVLRQTEALVETETNSREVETGQLAEKLELAVQESSTLALRCQELERENAELKSQLAESSSSTMRTKELEAEIEARDYQLGLARNERRELRQKILNELRPLLTLAGSEPP